jgi:hypothetical protein
LALMMIQLQTGAWPEVSGQTSGYEDAACQASPHHHDRCRAVRHKTLGFPVVLREPPECQRGQQKIAPSVQSLRLITENDYSSRARPPDLPLLNALARGHT